MITSSDIQTLVSEGNDERLVRLIYALLDLGQEQTKQRIGLLQQMGERYIILALAREGEQDINKALQHLDSGSLIFPPQRDPLALCWYKEASECFSAAIDQAGETFDCSMALRYRALAEVALRN